MSARGTVRRAAATSAAAAALLLAGCGTRPPSAVEPGGRDGVGPTPPPGLEQTPDAQPRVEALRVGGPNKPYEIGGRRYVPMTGDGAYRATGLASWYGRKFHGRPTASGEPYDMYAMTAAHPTMPIPSYARVRNPANGREVVVRVNDRGPFSEGRIIDLSYTAALKLGVLRGVAPVEVTRLTHVEIRAGLTHPEPAAHGAVATTAVPATAPAAMPSPWLALFDDPPPGDEKLRPGSAADGRGWWLQLGAFRVREAALSLQQRAAFLVTRSVDAVAAAAEPAAASAAAAAATVTVLDEGGLHRVRSGPYASRVQAMQALEDLRVGLGLTAVLIDRR